MSHFWDVIVFVLNGLVFLILGMQLPQIITDIPYEDLPVLILYGLLIFGVLIVIRLFVIFTFPLFSSQQSEKGTGFFSQAKKNISSYPGPE